MRAPTTSSRPCSAEPHGEAAEPRFALASIDISTGELIAATCRLTDLPGELARLKPGEFLVGDDLADDDALRNLVKDAGAALTPCPRAPFRLDPRRAGLEGPARRRRARRLRRLLSRGARGACRPPYLCGAHPGRPRAALAPAAQRECRTASADRCGDAGQSRACTARTRATRAGSLLAAIDRTVTAAGARELASRLAQPADRWRPCQRPARRGGLSRRRAASAPGLARRAEGRAGPGPRAGALAFGRGGPRDLGAVRDAASWPRTHLRSRLLRAGEALGLPRELMGIAERSGAAPSEVDASLSAALADELPVNARDGGFIADRLQCRSRRASRALRDGSRQVIAGLQATYAEATGIKSLKVRHNNVLGYFVEVTALHAPTLTATAPCGDVHPSPDAGQCGALLDARNSPSSRRGSPPPPNARWRSSWRFSPSSDGRGAGRGACSVRGQRRARRTRSLCRARRARRGAALCAAARRRQCRLRHRGRPPPDGRADLAARAEAPTSSATTADLAAAWTTATMPRARSWSPAPTWRGKSTFLRQNALIVVLAQAGSFVPAKAAHIGIVDRLFSRVGAADDLARGRSTFMVEMVETAAILNQATRRAPSWSSTRSAAARRPSTACPSPGRRSNICMRSIARASCSPRTITS